MDFCELYVSDKQELTGVSFTKDIKKARKYSVEFDNAEMKIGIWQTEARKLTNNNEIVLMSKPI